MNGIPTEITPRSVYGYGPTFRAASDTTGEAADVELPKLKRWGGGKPRKPWNAIPVREILPSGAPGRLWLHAGDAAVELGIDRESVRNGCARKALVRGVRLRYER